MAVTDPEHCPNDPVTDHLERVRREHARLGLDLRDTAQGNAHLEPAHLVGDLLDNDLPVIVLPGTAPRVLGTGPVTAVAIGDVLAGVGDGATTPITTGGPGPQPGP